MRTYKFKEISKIVNGATPSTSVKTYWNGDIPWLTPKDLTNLSNRYISRGHLNITQVGFDSCSTKLVPEGTILLSSRAPIGYLAIASCPLCTNQGFKSIVCNSNIVSNHYLYYWLLTRVDYLKSISSGATFKELSKDTLENVEVSLPNLIDQQHIVDTIRSVDDLIENYQNQLIKLNVLGITKINSLNESSVLSLLSNICSFDKGVELGSSNYIEEFEEGLIHYIRVGDLTSLTNTFVDNDLVKKTVQENDILIAFDGAPGRNAVGLKGAYSSGIYKVQCDELYKGLIYFELNSKHNQKIISDNSQGTTILHASKAIKFLEYASCSNDDLTYYSYLFDRIVNIKKKITILKENKKILLDKYFTNQ